MYIESKKKGLIQRHAIGLVLILVCNNAGFSEKPFSEQYTVFWLTLCLDLSVQVNTCISTDMYT